MSLYLTLTLRATKMGRLVLLKDRVNQLNSKYKGVHNG